MATENVEVGSLVQVLSSISKVEGVQLLVWWISLLAIVNVDHRCWGRLVRFPAAYPLPLDCKAVLKSVYALLAILPAFLVVIYVPNAFIAALGFAGMILAIIAILFPIYLMRGLKDSRLHYPELRSKGLLALFLVGILVIASEL